MLEPPFILSVFSVFVIGGITTAVLLVWKLTRVEQSLIERIATAQDAVEQKSEKQIRDLEQKHAAEIRDYYMRREVETKLFGDTIAALRQKIADVELASEKNFIRREGFYVVRDQIVTDMKAIREQVDARFLRIEEKLDDKLDKIIEKAIETAVESAARAMPATPVKA